MNKFGNIRKMIALAEPSYGAAKAAGLIDIPARFAGSASLSTDERQFINMCSCSYLGLDTHPRILDGAVDGIREAGALHLSTARLRLYSQLLKETEEALSVHFRCEAMVYSSCTVATAAFLPILASGFLTGDTRPLMLFDRFAHVSMHHVKPICGDETEVVTCANNDLNYIEDMCQKWPVVAYVSDGTYSISGHAPVQELAYLQEKYGLFLFLDDSHGLSITGKMGEGHVREHLPELSDRSVVVSSLGKAFGACGAMLMSGVSRHEVMSRYGSSWSQCLNSAGLGGVRAALELHRSEVLPDLQAKWRRNLQRLDEQFHCVNRGTKSPIRIIHVTAPDRAIDIARRMYERGFYVSAVFFPALPKGQAGLRVMPRADFEPATMDEFARVLREVAGDAVTTTEASSDGFAARRAPAA